MFAFHLAEKLGKTLGEVYAMPHSEYVGWQSYYTVKHNREDLARKAVGA